MTLARWEGNYEKSRQHIKQEKHHFANKGQIVKTALFPVVTYRCESWSLKKAEQQRIDAFEM